MDPSGKYELSFTTILQTQPTRQAWTKPHVTFNISIEEAGEIYKELHNRHAFFLEPETLTIRMANPFSGIPTDFKVHANGKTYFANCAWDMLGIPAALHCDAVIEAVCTESNESVQLEIRDGKVTKQRITCPFPFAVRPLV